MGAKPLSYDNIPIELQQLKQWCLWRYEDIGAAKPTKVPYQINGEMANVNKPETWSSFKDVVTAVFVLPADGSLNYSGIGFVFSDDDHYSFIDLDDTSGDVAAYDRQIKIYRDFDSYSEISPSGKGLHIIVKGAVPSGRRRNFIEIYSSQRYATFTGNVYNHQPIKDCQDKLLQLWEQMGSGGVATNLYKGDDNEKFNDQEIIEQCSSAANGEKFRTLYSGDWRSLYQSQSEADFAIIDIIAFYTQNRTQIARIFRFSQLGHRDKAKRKDYIAWMINKSFDRMLPPIDFDGFKIALDQKIAETNEPILPLNLPELIRGKPQQHNFPPGLLGQIANFIYAAAPRPVPEIALAAAIGLMAGICGRAYNIRGTGLNQYIILLAKTGRGKEAMASGIDKIINEVRKQAPTVDRFRGPGIINSGQALVKYLNKTSNCFVSVLGEFGITLDRISAMNANGADKMLYSTLLDLYGKSGFGQTFQPSIYSKQEDSVHVTNSPALTILGESTPGRFYQVLSEEMISQGLLPRFLMIEYNGDRVDENEEHYKIFPDQSLINDMSSLAANCETIMHHNKVVEVPIDQNAIHMLRSFNKYSDNKINSAADDVIAELWNRAHIKVQRLSALVAIGINYFNPMVTEECVKWAANIVQPNIDAFTTKFSAGDIGKSNNETKQQNDIVKNIIEYCTLPWNKICPAYCSKSFVQFHHDKIVPNEFFNRRTSRLTSFKNDKQNGTGNGATASIKRCLQILIDNGQLVEINTKEPKFTAKYGSFQGRAFTPTPKLFDK